MSPSEQIICCKSVVSPNRSISIYLKKKEKNLSPQSGLEIAKGAP